MFGRSTEMPRISAWSCIVISDSVIPPSTLNQFLVLAEPFPFPFEWPFAPLGV